MTESRRLDELVSVRGRFARSVRLDADAEQLHQLEGYLPTGRSLEVVRRLVSAMRKSDGTRAFSITGPYGSGKSSLALFIDSLLGRHDDPTYKAGVGLLREYDARTAGLLEDARRQLGAGPSGFIRAVITAPEREPITTTVLRALDRGARRAKVAKGVRDDLADALARAESPRYASPSYRDIRRLIERLVARKPLLIVVDEFGKNLEAYAEAERDSDLYLLQELAEWASGSEGLPLVLVTIQHLAFEAYVADATSTQRREWAKVQGRFEDIPFVDSAVATRTLIATALEHADEPNYTAKRLKVAAQAADDAARHGQAAIASPDIVAACYPLHPSTLLVLPELCARYGQNERTLFSFIASDEPNSLVSFTREIDVRTGLPWIRLDRVYDYFVDSASTFVGAARDASRWIEVETTIRDAQGLTPAQLRVIKTVGVLNLIASGGSLRASKEMVLHAIVDGLPGTETEDAVAARLRELTELGLLVYRDFASEFRLWRGSDFDLQGAVRSARQLLRSRSVASLLDDVQALRPVVAARHTIASGTTRAFARMYADQRTNVPSPDHRDDRADRGAYQRLRGTDGLLLYIVDSAGELPTLPETVTDRPIVSVVPHDPGALIGAALEVGALLQVMNDPKLAPDDQAARRELSERLAYARQVLEQVASLTFTRDAVWTWHNPVNRHSSPGKARRRKNAKVFESGGNTILSDVFDAVFSEAPEVRNETINRSELTSQGSKARRMLLEAALSPVAQRKRFLGLEGEGAEVAMYRAVLSDSGIHDPETGLQPPTKSAWRPVWGALVDALRSADGAPISIGHILQVLKAPPYGLRDGVASVVLTAGLVVHSSEIAIYEHGTFTYRLDAPLSERMARNPDNFSVKYLAANQGTIRHEYLEMLGARLATLLPTHPAALAAASRPTVLTLTRALVDVLQRAGDDFTKRTKQFDRLWAAENLSAAEAERVRRVRDAILLANEPDVLLFEALPRGATGHNADLPASGKGLAKDDLPSVVGSIIDAVGVIARVGSRLVSEVERVICQAADVRTVEEVVARAAELNDVELLAPEVRTFAEYAKLFGAYTDRASWLSAITEAVCGRSLKHWDDHTAPGALATLKRVAGDYARVVDLSRFASVGSGEPFRAYKIHATRHDGRSNRNGDILELPAEHVEDIESVVQGAVGALLTHFDGDEARARRALLAFLVEETVMPHDGAAGQAAHDDDPGEIAQ